MKRSVFAICLVLAAAVLQAETIKMKDGELISGSILSQTEYTLNLATSYGNITLNQREIEAILPDKHRLILKGGTQLVGVILDLDEFNLKLQTDDGAVVNVDMPQIVSIETYDYDRGENAQKEFVEKNLERQQAAAEIGELIGGNTLLTAYNAHFDLSFLYYLLARHGDPACLKGKDKLDLLTVYRDRRDYPHRLFNAIEAYGLQDSVQNSHRADEDTLATVSVMDAMAAERDDLAQYINLFGYIPKYGPPARPIRSVTYKPQPYHAPAPLYR